MAIYGHCFCLRASLILPFRIGKYKGFAWALYINIFVFKKMS